MPQLDKLDWLGLPQLVTYYAGLKQLLTCLDCFVLYWIILLPAFRISVNSCEPAVTLWWTTLLGRPQISSRLLYARCLLVLIRIHIYVETSFSSLHHWLFCSPFRQFSRFNCSHTTLVNPSVNVIFKVVQAIFMAGGNRSLIDSDTKRERPQAVMI